MRLRGPILTVMFAVVSVGRADPAFDLAGRIRSAAPGETLSIPAGRYRGPFLIDRPLRLHAQPGAILEGDGKTHVVEIRGADVELAGFIVRHSGTNLSLDHAGVMITGPRAIVRDNTIVDCLHGIYVKGANDGRLLRNVIRGRAQLETVADPIVAGLKLKPEELCSSEIEQNQRGNGIHLWKSERFEITGNDIRGTRDGIYFSFANHTQVRGNRISQVRYGLHYMYSNANTFEDNLFTDNVAGSALMYSNGITLRRNRFVANRSQRAYGILMHSVDDTHVVDNIIQGNTVGLFLEVNTSDRIEGNLVAGNYIGLRITDSSSENVITRNRFVRNLHPVESNGLNQANHWASDGRGNYWDDALRLDLNQDGVADLPHHEVDVFGPWRRPFPAIGLLSGSPGETLIRFIYSRVPVRGLSGITDPDPLVRAVSP